MTMYVLVEHTPEGRVTASLIGWPGVTAQGDTEGEAISHLRRSLTAHLGDAKVVPLELGVEQPWLQTVGIFKDDPFADELDALIAEYRREQHVEDAFSDLQDHAA